MLDRLRLGVIGITASCLFMTGCSDIEELGSLIGNDKTGASENELFEPMGAENDDTQNSDKQTEKDSNTKNDSNTENTDYSENNEIVSSTESDLNDEAAINSDSTGDDEETIVSQDSENTSDTNGNSSEYEEILSRAEEIEERGLLTSTADINLRDLDGNGTNYAFTYDGTDFSAVYITDNWKIIDSYRINNLADITIICQALIDVHPIHGQDMVSYREASDLAFEWFQHNIAYAALPDDNSLKSHAKDVDLDPADQGKSFEEMYEDRTGKELDINDFISEEDQDKLFDALKDVLNGQ